MSRIRVRTLAAAFAAGGLFMSAAHAQGVGGDAGKGNELFAQQCALCHAIGATVGGGLGPNLAGVLNRAAGSAPGFSYTRALINSRLVWDAATLDRFLAAPGQVVPGTTMLVSTPDPAARQDLIAYVSSVAVKPSGPSFRGLPATTTAFEERHKHGDWSTSTPGARRKIAVAQLAAPFVTPSAVRASFVIPRPAGATLSVPKGFEIRPFTTELTGPRLMRVAPNGDIFVAENLAGRIRVLRTVDSHAVPTSIETFVENLDKPYGIAFYPLGNDPQWVYVATNNSVLRFPYRNGDMKARGSARAVVARLADTTGGHWTRNIVFSADGARLFISVGSGSNVAEDLAQKTPEQIRQWEADHGTGAAWGSETHRAAVLVTDAEGGALRSFANGIRNCVGLAIQPATHDLWCSTNERDMLGDDLVPDYATRVHQGAFYGWPWYYLGAHEDPRHKGARPDLADKVAVPDVLFQAHSAALEIVFYDARAGVNAFPKEYLGEGFVALHGSWNRSVRTGHTVVRIRMKDGVPTGEYEDFLTGFVVDDDRVWGRPAGVVVARDGALLVAENGNNVIYRITPTRAPLTRAKSR